MSCRIPLTSSPIVVRRVRLDESGTTVKSVKGRTDAESTEKVNEPDVEITR